MGRSPCCSKLDMNRGAWTAAEDQLLIDHISKNGEGRWRSIPNEAGLKRCGKSCRLRWLNYLRPDIKRGNITADEEDLIVRLHRLLGNRWSLIAGRLPGRTDNEIKNYWSTTLVKKLHPPPPISHKTRVRKNGSQSEGASKAVRTKAVRCSKVVLVNGGGEASPASSDYGNMPMDFGGVVEMGDPLQAGSDPDFWTMLNEWIMVDDGAAA